MMYGTTAFAMTHALGMATEYAKHSSLAAGLLLWVRIRAFCIIRYPVSIPHLLAYPSGSMPGLLVANPMYFSCAGRSPPLRFFFESLLSVMTMAYGTDPDVRMLLFHLSAFVYNMWAVERARDDLWCGVRATDDDVVIPVNNGSSQPPLPPWCGASA